MITNTDGISDIDNVIDCEMQALRCVVTMISTTDRKLYIVSSAFVNRLYEVE